MCMCIYFQSGVPVLTYGVDLTLFSQREPRLSHNIQQLSQSCISAEFLTIVARESHHFQESLEATCVRGEEGAASASRCFNLSSGCQRKWLNCWGGFALGSPTAVAHYIGLTPTLNKCNLYILMNYYKYDKENKVESNSPKV